MGVVSNILMQKLHQRIFRAEDTPRERLCKAVSTYGGHRPNHNPVSPLT